MQNKIPAKIAIISNFAKYSSCKIRVFYSNSTTLYNNGKFKVISIGCVNHYIQVTLTNEAVTNAVVNIHKFATMDNTTVLTMNETLDRPTFDVNIGYAVFMPLLILVIIVMNLGTIYAFWKVPTLREKPSELLILNLACADLLTGTTVLPLTSPLYITPGVWTMGEIGCGIVVFFLNLSISGSLFALMTISIDRFLLVYMEYPRYVKTMTRKRVYKVIAVGWMFAFLTIIIELSLWERAKKIDETARNIDFNKVCLSPARRVEAFALSFFLTLFLLPVLVVCSLSIGFLYQLRLRLQKIRKQRPETSREKVEDSTRSTGVDQSTEMSEEITSKQSDQRPSKPTDNQKSKRMRALQNRYIKPGITLIGVVLAMAICMLPFSFYVIITEAGCEKCNNTDILYGLLLMQFCNASIDPFIYVLTRRKIRTFYMSVFKGSRSSWI